MKWYECKKCGHKFAKDDSVYSPKCPICGVVANMPMEIPPRKSERPWGMKSGKYDAVTEDGSWETIYETEMK